MKPDYLYVAEVVQVLDGDTLRVDVDLGFRTSLNTLVRLYGIDAPTRSSAAGRAATAYVQDWLAGSMGVVIRSAHPGEYGDKYGRWLATVYQDVRCLNQDLVSAGMALSWDGTGVKPVPAAGKPA